MPTPFESAQLILTLYDQRREPLMRQARDFMFGFDPRSFEEMMTIVGGPNGAFVRQVIGYWDMAASLVANGAIDRQMFLDSTAEFLPVFGKIEPFLPQLREMFVNPDYLKSLEALTLSLPNARERIDTAVKRVRGMIAARAAAAAGQA